MRKETTLTRLLWFGSRLYLHARYLLILLLFTAHSATLAFAPAHITIAFADVGLQAGTEIIIVIPANSHRCPKVGVIIIGAAFVRLVHPYFSVVVDTVEIIIGFVGVVVGVVVIVVAAAVTGAIVAIVVVVATAIVVVAAAIIVVVAAVTGAVVHIVKLVIKIVAVTRTVRSIFFRRLFRSC